MDLIDFIRLGNEAPPLRFLIIGGYAVAAHGHTRATFDVDFLVRRDDHDSWFFRIAAAGLKLFGETNAFAQFNQEGGGDGLDLMFVDEPTFEQMWQDSLSRQPARAEAPRTQTGAPAPDFQRRRGCGSTYSPEWSGPV